MRKGAPLELLFTNKELGLLGDVELKGSLGASDHDMAELRMLRAGRRGLTAPAFRTAHSGLFQGPLARVPWHRATEARGAQESCWMVKNPLLQAPECSVPTRGQSG